MENRLFRNGILILFIGIIFIPSIGSNITNTEISEINDSNINLKVREYGVDDYIIKDTVGFWNFNEGFGNRARDRSKYRNHGRCVGTQWTKDTPFDSGHAIIFSSSTNSFVGINDEPILDFDYLEEDEGFMIDLWMKKIMTPSGYAGLVAKIYSDGGYSVIINRHNKIGFYLYGANGVLETLYSETIINDTSKWHHIVCIWFEGTMYLFIDDMENPDATIYVGDFQIGNTHKWLDIGNDWPTDNENPFDGKIDEVRISIIQKHSPPPSQDLIGIICNSEISEENVSFFAIIVFEPFTFKPFILEQVIFPNNYSGYIGRFFIRASFYEWY